MGLCNLMRNARSRGGKFVKLADATSSTASAGFQINFDASSYGEVMFIVESTSATLPDTIASQYLGQTTALCFSIFLDGAYNNQSSFTMNGGNGYYTVTPNSAGANIKTGSNNRRIGVYAR